MAQVPESAEILLPRLFILMEKSDSINCLPRERIETIKGKYRNSSLEQIKRGILMLEKDIGEKESRQQKSREALMKNSEKMRELRKIDELESKKSEKLADEMLKGVGAIENKKEMS